MISRSYNERRKAEYIRCDVSDLSFFLTRESMSPANVANGFPGDLMEKRDAEWYGGATCLADIHKLFAEGWADGAARLHRMAEEIAAPVQELTVVRRRTIHAEQGDTLDAWRAMAGDWDTAWDAQAQQERQGSRVVTIGTGWGGNANRTAEQLFWSGAQVIVAADLLERAGYSVEILAACPTKASATTGKVGGGKGTGTRGTEAPSIMLAEVTVKRADEPLRIDQVAAIFCHAGTFRTAGFGMYNATRHAIGYGLGHHYDPAKAYADMVAAIPEAVAPRFLMPDAFDRMTAERNIANLVAELEAAAGGAA